MPYKSHRVCPICQSSIKDISTHLRQKHNLERGARKRYLDIAKRSSKSYEENPTKGNETSDTWSSESLDHDNETAEVDTTCKTNLENAICLLPCLREYFTMGTEKKRKYLTYNATDEFIKFLRDCILNARHGNMSMMYIWRLRKQTQHIW